MNYRTKLDGNAGGRWVVGAFGGPRIRLTLGGVFNRITPELQPGAYYAPGYSIDDGELYYVPYFLSWNIDVRDSNGNVTTAPGIESPDPDVFRYMPDGSGVWGPYANSVPAFDPMQPQVPTPAEFNLPARYFDGKEYLYVQMLYSYWKRTKLRILGFTSGSFLEVCQSMVDDFWSTAPVWTSALGRVFPSVGASMTFNFSHYRAAEFYLHAVGTSSAGWHHMLLSPRHVIGALHVMANPGDTLYWVDATGTLRTSTVVRKQAVGAASGAADLGLIYLSTPITTITPISLVGPDTLRDNPILGNYVDGSNGQWFSSGWKFSDTSVQKREFSHKAFYLRRNPKYVVFWEVGPLVPNSSHSLNVIPLGADSGEIQNPVTEFPSGWTVDELYWFGTARGGDSGSPAFYMYDGKFVGLTAMYGIGGGPPWCRYVREITDAMNTIKDGSDPVVYAPDLV